VREGTGGEEKKAKREREEERNREGRELRR